jgi:hypothetical protein
VYLASSSGPSQWVSDGGFCKAIQKFCIRQTKLHDREPYPFSFQFDSLATLQSPCFLQLNRQVEYIAETWQSERQIENHIIQRTQGKCKHRWLLVCSCYWLILGITEWPKVICCVI